MRKSPLSSSHPLLSSSPLSLLPASSFSMVWVLYVGITADVGPSRALLSDRQCHFYGSVKSVPEAFYTGITCFMQLQSIMYISPIVVVDLRYAIQAIQSILCCAYITILPVISITVNENWIWWAERLWVPLTAVAAWLILLQRRRIILIYKLSWLTLARTLITPPTHDSLHKFHRSLHGTLLCPICPTCPIWSISALNPLLLCSLFIGNPASQDPYSQLSVMTPSQSLPLRFVECWFYLFVMRLSTITIELPSDH
jgi:hypothetical protein